MMSEPAHFRYRRLKNTVVLTCTAAAAIVTILPLLLILGYLVMKGAGSINLNVFIHEPRPVGVSGGGMANAIVGTLELVALACVMGIPLGLGAGIYLARHKHDGAGFILGLASDVLSGLPSIVVGIFAYELLVRPMGGFSAFSGGAALAIILIPMVTRTTAEMVGLLSRELYESALALGITRWRTMLSVIVPSARAGIVTGIILGIARIAGETAPLLFTAFGNRFWSTNIFQPIASLTMQVYVYAISPFPDWQRQAWAGALLLTGLILCLEAAVRRFGVESASSGVGTR